MNLDWSLLYSSALQIFYDHWRIHNTIFKYSTKYSTRRLLTIIHAFWPLTLLHPLSELGAAASNVTSCAGIGHQCSLAKTQAAFPQAQHYRSDYYLHCVSALFRIPICFLSSPHNTVHHQHVRSTVQLRFTLKHSHASPFHNKKTGKVWQAL